MIVSIRSLLEVRHIFVPILDEVSHLMAVLTVPAFTLQSQGEPVEGVSLGSRIIDLCFLSWGLMHMPGQWFIIVHNHHIVWRSVVSFMAFGSRVWFLVRQWVIV